MHRQRLLRKPVRVLAAPHVSSESSRTVHTTLFNVQEQKEICFLLIIWE